jgi:O-antigen biosynthesis protein WbqP
MYKNHLKRPLDALLAAGGMIVFSPLFVVIALIIKLESKGPVFFRQTRIGKDGIPFEIYKFRTMLTLTPKDMPTHLLNDPSRYITRFGAFLRRSSLDEIPQCFNILKGDMSVVGPRPALWNQDDLIAAREAVGANAIRPGLTGWAQINGRDELPIDRKAALDGDYVTQLSFRMDARIFFATFIKTLRAEGVREGKRS